MRFRPSCPDEWAKPFGQCGLALGRPLRRTAKARDLAEQFVKRDRGIAEAKHGQRATESEQRGAILAGFESSGSHGVAHIRAMVIT